MKQTMKGYIINFRPAFVWSIVGLAIVFASSWLFQSVALSPTLRILLALIPLIPACLFLYYLVKGIRGLDELQQRIYTETATLTFIVTVLMAFLFGSLQRAGLYTAKWDDIGNTMMFVWVCIYLLNDWRYR
ncbi:MAG TPA: hypothetical protein VF896_11605 [Anaerolineales bacterium]